MSVIKYKHHGSSSALILLSQHHFFSAILLASVSSPAPVRGSLILSWCWAPGVTRLSRSSPFVWRVFPVFPMFPAPGPVSPVSPWPDPNWNILLAMSSQACVGLPTLSLLWYFHNATNCHGHPGERTNNTFLQSQVAQCKSRQVNSSWHSFKYWPWEPTESVLVSSAESPNWSSRDDLKNTDPSVM